jgi:hypothetical protein
MTGHTPDPNSQKDTGSAKQIREAGLGKKLRETGPAKLREPVSPGQARETGSSKRVAASLDEPQKIKKAPEHSLGLRIICFCMTLVVIGAAIFFVSTSPLMMVAFIAAACAGHYLAYQLRNTDSGWPLRIVFIGIMLMGAICWLELSSGYEKGEFSPYAPFLHFLVGTFVAQSFELRSRNDINTSILLGLLVLAMIAPNSKSIIFGACLIVYLCLYAAMLYLDCLSRSKQSWLTVAIEPSFLRPVVGAKRPFLRGNAFLCLSIFPFATFVLFFYVPRTDSVIDRLYAAICSRFNTQTPGAPLMVPETTDPNAKRWKAPVSKHVLNENPKTTPKISGSKPENGGHEDQEKSKNAAHSERDGAGGSEKPAAGAKKSAAAAGKTKTSGKLRGGEKEGSEPDESKGPEEAIPYDDEMNQAQTASTDGQILFTVRSTRTCFMRLYSFDKFDGQKWTATDTGAFTLERPARGGFDLSTQKAFDIPANYPAVTLVQDVVMEHDLSRNVPAAWIPKGLELNTPSITVDDYGTIRLADRELKKGLKFKVTSAFPVYDVESMRKAAPMPAETADDLRFRMSPYLQLPDNLPDDLLPLAEEVTKTGQNWFAKAELASKYLKTHYKYSYHKSFAGSKEPLTDFLFGDSKEGDCKDFASALAMVCRIAGIPARVVVGFTPGEVNTVKGVREIKARNRHAWTEVYIQGFGWVPFDATPKGYLPDRPPEKVFDLSSLKKSEKEELDQIVKSMPVEKQEGEKRFSWQEIVVAVIVLAIIGICGFFIVRVILQRLKQARENRPGHHPAKKFLKMVETDLKKWKVSRENFETASEFSTKVRGVASEQLKVGAAGGKEIPILIEDFMENYDAAYYGNKDVLAKLEDLSKRIHSAIGAGGKN